MSEGRLSGEIRGRSREVRGLLISLSALANELRTMSLPVAAEEAVLGMRVELACAVAALNALDACVGAAAMTGGMVAETRAVDMELHPVRLETQDARLKMLQSLHRAGDHSLDPEPDEQNLDRNVPVEMKGVAR
jgi:hypothetical protein